MQRVHLPGQGAGVRHRAALPGVRLLGAEMRQEEYTAILIGVLALIVGCMLIRSLV